MEESEHENSKKYLISLIAMSLIGGFSGWVVQSVHEGMLIWTLPLFCIWAALTTINGDSIVESLFVILICGVIVAFALRVDALTIRVGVGTIWGIFIALSIAKIGFAMCKLSNFGGRGFN